MLLVTFIVTAFVASVFTQAPPAPPAADIFPPELVTNATVDGKTCYFSKPLVFKNWQQASDLCQKYKTKLVSLESAASNEQLMKIWKEAGSPRTTNWLDGNDLETKGTYVWHSIKKPIEWKNWAPGHPITIGSDRRCLAAIFGLLHTSQWINLGCERISGFICCDKSL